MKKIKVLQVMPDFLIAGAEIMCENLINELVKEDNIDINVVSFFTKNTEITKRLEKKGIRIIYLDKKKGFDITMFKKLKEIITLYEPDVIHTHRYALEYIVPTVRLLIRKKIKIIHTVHSIAEKEVPKWLRVFQKNWFKQRIVNPVAISECVKQSIIDVYNLESEDIPIVYNGILLENCIPKKNYSLNNNILHIGRFCDVKNHTELIDIFYELSQKYPNMNLLLIGDGPLLNTIKDQVKNLNIENKVHFLGVQENCFKYLSTSDIFILPSKYEGMPMTIIEAMGTGLPIVSRPVGGINDMIVDGKNGLLPKSKEETLNSLELLLDNIDLRKKLGTNALRDSELFSSKKMAKNYIKLYGDKK